MGAEYAQHKYTRNCMQNMHLGPPHALTSYSMPKKEKKEKPSNKAAAKEEAGSAGDAQDGGAWVCPSCEYPHEGEDACAKECVSCGEPRPAPPAAAEDEDDKYRGYSCGQILGIEELEKGLKACKIDVGKGQEDDQLVVVVTNATNVAEGSRVVVCGVGASVVLGGEEIFVAKRSVGGQTSNGMLCDAPMLGWTGGGAGDAAKVPESFAPGDRPPERRPRMDGK